MSATAGFIKLHQTNCQRDKNTGQSWRFATESNKMMETMALAAAQQTHSPSRPQLSPPGATALTTPSLLPFKLEKTPMYSSPPPATSNPENNTCKLIEYRGAKVAAFSVDGRELICLPQAFELFLKHLVGGLHTVYTKLKRLEIVPIVCNVEQVRILRGLGAIQPGVNRCKLISPKEFDVLYDDCTNSSARPGRPPKRSAIMTANPDTLEKLKKSRMDNGDFAFPPSHISPGMDPKKSALFGNGYHYPPHLAPIPFMPMAHPAMMSMAMAGHLGMRQDSMPFHNEKDYHNHKEGVNSVTHPAISMAMARYLGMHQDTMALCTAQENQTLKSVEAKEDRNDHPQDKPLDLNMKSDDNHNIKRHSHSPDHETGTNSSEEPGQLNLTKINHLTDEDPDDLDDDDSLDDGDEDDLDDDNDLSSSGNSSAPATKTSSQSLAYASQLLNTADNPAGVSSIETLLMNIQGLLKVAAENAKHHERQIKYEKAELKLSLQREKETREQIEKHLTEEQQNKLELQRRLKKERRARRKLQEQLEMIMRQGPVNIEEQNNQTFTPVSSHSRISENVNDEPPVLESRPPQELDRSSQDTPTNTLKGYMDSILGTKTSCNTSTSNGFMHSPTNTTPPIVQSE